MRKLELALIQMCSGTDPARNLDDAETMIRKAARAGARLVLTPETATLVQRDAEALRAQLCDPDSDPARLRFSRLAAALKIDLLVGSMAQKGGADGRAVNRAHLFAPDGALTAIYDKIHMFDVQLGEEETYSESAHYAPGSTAVVVQVGNAQLGLTICYDVRFAALYRRLAQAGAEMIAVPAAFTRPTGRAHWEILLRARAIETGCFILAPAQGGHHEDGRNTWGRSMVIGPWGEIIARLDHDEPGVLMAEIDLDEVTHARARIPALGSDREFTIS